ncbi:MAG: Rid family hydrolase [Candidatus Dormibacteraceae bacterium]
MQPTNPPRNVNPEDLGPARGFSHATSAGGLVWLGGQIGSDATGKVLEPGDIVAQYKRAVRNVSIALRAVGSAPADTVKLTYYVTDLKAYKDNLRAIGAAYREVFGQHYPATTLVEVRSLFDPDALIEIDAVAVCPA